MKAHGDLHGSCTESIIHSRVWIGMYVHYYMNPDHAGIFQRSGPYSTMIGMY